MKISNLGRYRYIRDLLPTQNKKTPMSKVAGKEKGYQVSSSNPRARLSWIKKKETLTFERSMNPSKLSLKVKVRYVIYCKY